jgi:eukaryotic-like serine/threonine-protein kinase
VDTAPETIDRYTIEAVLGEGGMGRVYRALDPRLGRRVAVKVLLAEGASEEARHSAAARMVREARAAAAFNHPNVVAVYDVGEFDGNPFIAMELVNGTTMRTAFADPTVSPTHKLAWLLDIARGLGAAHRAGLVHRDVKPDNVMITADGVAKILDFGIARSTEVEIVDPTAPTSGANLATLTARGVAMGTPQYMSPEQLYSEPVDGRTDQFSWGVMTWEALAGGLPWGPKTGAQLITAILATTVPPLSEVAPGTEPRVTDAVARALEKKREHRFATMEDLVASIEGEAALPRSPGSSSRMPVLRLDSKRPFTHPTSASRQALPKKRPFPKVPAVAVAAVAAIGLGWFAIHPRPSAHPPRAEVTDALPAPPIPGLPADIAPFFARATRDEREGRHDWACQEYRHAVDAFPTSPEALLALTFCYRGNPSDGRSYFRRTWALRSALSPRDAAALDAFEPLFQRDPADYLEAKHRFEAAIQRFPDDPALHFYLAGAYRQDYKDVQRAVGEAERSLALDPEQPYVLSILSDFHAYDGDFPAVHDTIARCLRIAPGTLDCLEEDEWLDGQEGECAKVESIARRMLAIEPGNDEGVHALANALYAQGGSIETVRQLLSRTQGADAGATDPRTDEAKMAVLSGDFTTAEKIARSLVESAGGSAAQGDHGVPMRLLVAIEREMGHDADAAKVARAYLDGRDAWEPNPDFDDWAMHDEPTPTMLTAERAVGAITKSAYDAEIARTVERWTARATPSTRNFIWVYAQANPVETASDAAAALAAQSGFLPVPRFMPLSLADEAVGRTYALGGRTDDAIVTLERAAHSCFPLDHPIEHTHAQYELGVAREAKGDVAGACAAYAVVTQRWGKAKPRSVTAARSSSRVAALKCK